MATAKWRVHARHGGSLEDHLCQLRGISPADLGLNFATGLHDPSLLPGIDAACRLVKQAKKERWPVTIFGDYDADGTPAAALLASLLSRLGIDFTVIIPTRAAGYGLRMADVETIAAQSKLLILVDTGITAVEPIAALKQKGVEVIVLDHHLPKDQLPPTEALVDPFLPSSRYPFNGLCGCALAYKLAVALAPDFPNELSEGFLKWSLDLVAISTVADMMVMKGENRVLVHYGLQVLRQTRRPGLRALMAVAGVNTDKLSAGTLGFTLGPRLNATGRLGDNRPALDLLMATDETEALRLAKKIEASNRERQALVESTLQEAYKLLFKQNDRSDHCFVVVGNNWPTGVVGLVAGKITGQFNRPTVVLSQQEKLLTGSARSIGAYSIIDGLASQQQLLSRFGGHRQAAGLALEAQSLPKFIDGLKAHAKEHIPVEDLAVVITADAILAPEEISLTTVETIDKFQPFGQENYAPRFIIESAKLGPAKLIGASGDHLKWQAKLGSQSLEVIGFGMADRLKSKPLEHAHLLGYLEKNVWQDQTRLQVRLVDFQPATAKFELI